MNNSAKKAFLSGNAAIARGAWEAGCKFAAAYPGTPSTEIMEFCGTYDEIDAQWAVNEKTAMETVIGACFGGTRAICSQKHVGLNVAADPFFTASYIGVNAGLVIVTADDPGMHSSQNEQDNRYYAMMSKMPLLEPSDSQEAKDMTIEAFEISERFNTPVLIRTTTRVSHSETIVQLGERREQPEKEFVPDMNRYCTLPNISRQMHVKVEKRALELEKYAAEESKFNYITMGDPKIGIIASGVAYRHAKEAFPQASFLKLGMSWPYPNELIKRFASKVQKVIVIEEGDPFIEKAVRTLGINCVGKNLVPLCGELNPDILSEVLSEVVSPHLPVKTGIKHTELASEVPVPGRPPVLCPGCPHRGIFYVLSKLKCIVTGDIGCYSLGAYAPHNAMHSIVCMGASITTAMGLSKAMKDKIKGKLVAVIGESTFMHSGMTSLLDTVYNKGNHLTIILDNSITAMTGHQPNPASGKTLKGEPAKSLDFVKVCHALGISKVSTVDPFDLKAVETLVKARLQDDEPSVIIAQRPCYLLKDYKPKIRKVTIDIDKCVKCGMCLKVGCPAVEVDPVDKKTRLNMALCVHCGLCAQMCKPGAITQEQEEN
ncbi:MAG: indolepyruvate ferredoxin oxidoreductase subunit alpha [Candidatus Riflebacteria bacterium]|nr:indolepyruvate ferredoxin oxidoreductase subunit alpha [Candidatus Riflebacteria bacterium]